MVVLLGDLGEGRERERWEITPLQPIGSTTFIFKKTHAAPLSIMTVGTVVTDYTVGIFNTNLPIFCSATQRNYN